MVGTLATKVRRIATKEDTTGVEMAINATADASFMAGVLGAASTNDETLAASEDSRSPYSFSATPTNSRVAPGESGEGSGLLEVHVDGEGGEEKCWAANPIMFEPDRTGSAGV